MLASTGFRSIAAVAAIWLFATGCGSSATASVAATRSGSGSSLVTSGASVPGVATTTNVVGMTAPTIADVATTSRDVATTSLSEVVLPSDTCGWTGRASVPITVNLATVHPGDIIEAGLTELDPATYFGLSSSGDLDGDGVEDTIIDVICSGGGTGSTNELHAYKSDGTALGLIPYGSANATRPPFSSGGDRESITDVRVESGSVTVYYVAHLDSDPMCCPSLQVTDTIEYSGSAFELIDRVSVLAPGASAVDEGTQRNPGGTYSEFGVYERVEFPTGSTGTTVSAAVAPHTVNGYLVSASAGQTLHVELAAENAVFDLYAPDDTLIVSGATGPEVHELQMDGDYLVVVQSEFGGAAFDLLISVT